jgi:hypothetical protein
LTNFYSFPKVTHSGKLSWILSFIRYMPLIYFSHIIQNCPYLSLSHHLVIAWYVSDSIIPVSYSLSCP